MHSSYQHHETHYADLSLSVHCRIDDLHRRADGLAPRVAESALDSGCTDTRSDGLRQSRAWDMVAEAHGWNAISDDPETLNEAERCEREGIAYRVEYGDAGFQVVLTEPPADPEPEATETVPTSALRVGDVVLEHGMRVRIDAVNPYDSHTGQQAWSCPGTVLNLPEVLAAKIVPASFLKTYRWEDGRGWVTDRTDSWTVQGNDLARWAIVRRTPEEQEAEARAHETSEDRAVDWLLRVRQLQAGGRMSCQEALDQANREAEQALDQAQREVNQQLLAGRMTKAEHARATAAINADRRN